MFWRERRLCVDMLILQPEVRRCGGPSLWWTVVVDGVFVLRQVTDIRPAGQFQLDRSGGRACGEPTVTGLPSGLRWTSSWRSERSKDKGRQSEQFCRSPVAEHALAEAVFDEL